jgi:CheY-like chemotaxis protein
MTQLPLLVLVDPDPKGLDTLTFAFERDGFPVSGTSDPRLARQLVRGAASGLVVVSLRDPERDALELIGGLHSHPETRSLPVVALGPTHARTAALTAGASEYLDTPVFVRDVISISRLAIPMRQAADNGGAPEVSARLADYQGLFYLIRAMVATGRSGILQLSRGSRRGEVRFSEGAVTSAQVGSLQGFPALNQLLLWKDGALSLKLRDVPRRGQFSLSPRDMLDDCEHFLRDFAHAAGQLGDVEMVYHLVVTCPLDAAGLPPNEVGPVARLFDGRRPLGDVIEESPFRIFDTLRIVGRLVEAGALRADGTPAVERPPAERTRSGRPSSQGLRSVGAAASPGAGPERRGVGGERRKTRSQRIVPFSKPAAAVVASPPPAAPVPAAAPAAPAPARARPTPAPIPLLAKKSSTGPVTTVAGEIDPGRQPLRPRAKTLPPVAVQGPSVQVQPVEPAGPPRMSLDAPVPEARGGSGATAVTPPAAAGRPAPRAAGEASARVRRAGGAPSPASGFSDLEADFFAREADLYKRESVDDFEDLAEPRRPAPGRPPPRPARKKRR